MTDHIIWQSTVDNRTWLCKVTRIDRDHGELTITRLEDRKTICREPVDINLAHESSYGQDIADVYGWENRCLEKIDAHG